MTPRRAVSALLAVLAATMLVTGSFGFTSVSADRGVSVNVVDSENAYVGVAVCERSNGEGFENGNGTNKVEVNVSNQFSDSFTVEEIAVDESGDSDVEPESIRPGESHTFEIEAHDHVTVEVSDGLDASVTAEVGGKCNGQNPENNANRNQTGVQNAGGTPTPTAEPTERSTETPTPEADAE